MKKLLLFGSSHVAYLRNYDITRVHHLSGEKVRFIYRPFSGKSFEFFINNPYLIDRVLRCVPDYILVLFGGNSIKYTVQKSEVLTNCRIFYEILHEKIQLINPNAIIIAHQVPLRFNRNPNNKHHCPPPQEFKIFRDYLNNKIKKLWCKHYMILIGGPNCLDNESMFRDGVHLNVAGLKIQLLLIIEKLDFIISYQKSLPQQS